MFNLMLYARYFGEEFLPFLTEKQLKLDFKYSLDRDGFYNRFQAIQRKIDHFREENARLAEGLSAATLELEIRKRTMKLTRQVEIDAARLFHAVRVFAADLGEDADGDGVKCLNGAERSRSTPSKDARPSGTNGGRRSFGAVAARLRGGGVSEHPRDRRPGERACR